VCVAGTYIDEGVEARLDVEAAMIADWIVMGGKPGETSYCIRCGEGLRLSLPQRVEIVTAALNAFVKIHSKCKAGNEYKESVTHPSEWRAGRDTGTSSLTIYDAVTGNRSGRHDIPYDPADFGRCYRFLKLFPAFRDELHKTVKLCSRWKPFVEAWDELTALYEEELPSGRCPKLYDRMKQLEKPLYIP
jgi:hypothetical protein